jgi:hypothetical protein
MYLKRQYNMALRQRLKNKLIEYIRKATLNEWLFGLSCLGYV